MVGHTILLRPGDPDEAAVLDGFLAACDPEDRVDLKVQGDRIVLRLG